MFPSSNCERTVNIHCSTSTAYIRKTGNYTKICSRSTRIFEKVSGEIDVNRKKVCPNPRWRHKNQHGVRAQKLNQKKNDQTTAFLHIFPSWFCTYSPLILLVVRAHTPPIIIFVLYSDETIIIRTYIFPSWFNSCSPRVLRARRTTVLTTRVYCSVFHYNCVSSYIPKTSSGVNTLSNAARR